MAIAETELKKSDGDDTLTGGCNNGSDTANKSKLPREDESHQPGSSSSSKMYSLYSNLKGFAFSMPDGWDDRNISIFLACCRESIDDFRDPSGNNDENHIWHKIAKEGEDKSGSTTCFTVNSCIELAQCLKGYVIKNEKRIDNEAFKILYDDIIDLLPYFPGSAESVNKNVRHRSRSKSTEKKDVYSKSIPSVDSDGSTISQKEHRSFSTHQIENLIVSYCEQNLHLFGMPKTPVAYIWNDVSQKVFEKTGVKVDVKKKLEWIKRKIVKEANKESDRKVKAKKFSVLCRDYIKFFDYMPPRTIKKKSYLGADDVLLKEDPPLIVSLPKNNTPVTNVETDVEYVHKKRRFSKTNTSEASGVETVAKSSEQPVANVTKEVVNTSETKVGEKTDNGALKSSPDDVSGSANAASKEQQEKVVTESPASPMSDKAQVSSAGSDQKLNSVPESPGQSSTKPSDSENILSDPNVTTTTWVKETSPDTSESDTPSKGRSSYLNEHPRLEEDPDAVFFETKYTLRGVTDNVKCYKPRQRKTRKPRAQGGLNFEKRVLPQRMTRTKGKSEKLGEEETLLSPQPPSPEPRGYPVQSSPLPVVSKAKRDYTRKPKIDEANKRKIPLNEAEPPSPKKRIYQRKNQKEDVANPKETKYSEKVHGLTRKQEGDDVDSEPSSKRSVVLEHSEKPNSSSQVLNHSPKPVSGIHSMEKQKEIDMGGGGRSQQQQEEESSGSSAKPGSSSAAYCPDSNSGSAELCRPSSSSGTIDVVRKVNELEDMDATAVAVIEKYKNKVGESSHANAVLQLIPSAGSVSSAICQQPQPPGRRNNALVSAPPEWFGSFVQTFKKHEMWKMSQLVKMQQELMDMENKKLAVLEKILGTLKKE